MKSEQWTSDGATLAFLSAMAGAMLAQLPEFQPADGAGLTRALVLGSAVLALCVSGVMSARHIIRSSRLILLSIGIFVAAALVIFQPEINATLKGGAHNVHDLKPLSIKVVVGGYVLLWTIYYTVVGWMESKA